MQHGLHIALTIALSDASIDLPIRLELGTTEAVEKDQSIRRVRLLSNRQLTPSR